MKAKIRNVWCGSIHVDLGDVLNTALFLTINLYRNGAKIQRKLDETYACQILGTVAKFRPIMGCYHVTSINRVMEIFSYAQTSRCTDARDRVYGVRSLLPPAFQSPVNYSVPTADVYAACTYYLMTGSRSLEPLRLRHSLKLDASLPSWVPDYSALHPHFDGSDGTDEYHADRGAAFFATYEYPLLRVQALEVDTVAICDRFFSEDEFDQQLPGDPEADAHFREALRRWRCTAVNFATHNRNRDESTMEIAAWRAVVPDRLPDCHPQSHDCAPSGYYKYVDAEMALGLTRWLFATQNTAEAKLNDILRTFFWTRIIQNSFFVTEGGRMGSVLGDCKVGDTIAVLAGLSRPVLLRAVDGKDKSKRQFLSHCYCDGMCQSRSNQQTNVLTTLVQVSCTAKQSAKQRSSRPDQKTK